MRQTIVITAAVLLLASCSDRVVREQQTNEPVSETADEQIAVNEPESSEEPEGEMAQSDVRLKGTVMHTRSYCGGAPPPEKLLEEFRKPLPYAEQSLVLKNRTTGKSYTLTTKSDGTYELLLSPGMYDVFHSKRPGTLEQLGYDPNCDEWLKTKLAEISVGEQAVVSGKIITIHLDCEPCNPAERMRP
jgi:hypothetical protein